MKNKKTKTKLTKYLTKEQPFLMKPTIWTKEFDEEKKEWEGNDIYSTQSKNNYLIMKSTSLLAMVTCTEGREVSDASGWDSIVARTAFLKISGRM